jgi:hypothetical protein
VRSGEINTNYSLRRTLSNTGPLSKAEDDIRDAQAWEVKYLVCASDDVCNPVVVGGRGSSVLLVHSAIRCKWLAIQGTFESHRDPE